MLYLQGQLGIGSYRTVWLMGHKIRKAMEQRDAQYTLKGPVQADEVFIGGKQTLEERRKFGTNKTPFFSGVEEGPKATPRFVTFQELEKVWEEHVLPAIEKNNEKGSTIKANGAAHYSAAEKKTGYGHQRSIAMNDPKKTAEHLKWVNMLTSNLKRFLLSTYHGVFPKYHSAYLAEFALTESERVP